MILVYCLNAYPRPQSRTLTILNWLKENQVKFIYALPGFKPSLNRTFRHFIPSICTDYYRARLLDGLFLALSIYPSIFWQSVFKRRKCIVFVCFESWDLYPFLWIYRLMGISKVVVDLGYPAEDISAASLPSGYIQKVTVLENCLNHSGINLLLESEQQSLRVKTLLPKSSVFPHFVLDSSGLDYFADTTHTCLPAFLDPYSKYLLFRGTLNQESGILQLVHAFSAYVTKFPDFPLNLIVHGSGQFKSELQELVPSLYRVYFYSDFLDAPALSKLMSNATALLGQFNTLSPRPLLTIPHKFVESLKLGKLYITPFFPPMDFYLQNLLQSDDFDRIKKSNDPFLDWLSILYSDPSFCDSPRVQSASTATLDRMKAINQKSLSLVLSEYPSAIRF